MKNGRFASILQLIINFENLTGSNSGGDYEIGILVSYT
jgi:hypothetical protein